MVNNNDQDHNNLPETLEMPSEDDLVTSLNEEIAQLKDQRLRALAELENFRKRAEKEKEDALKYAATNFSREMLSVADNLRRALECIPEGSVQDGLKPFVEGVEMTEKGLLKVFEQQGIKPVGLSGDKFDPHFHQAMMEIPYADQEPGTIVQVLQSGYTLHDRLLRPALVGVSKKG